MAATIPAWYGVIWPFARARWESLVKGAQKAGVPHGVLRFRVLRLVRSVSSPDGRMRPHGGQYMRQLRSLDQFCCERHWLLSRGGC